MAFDPQKALESAVVARMRLTIVSGGLGYGATFCARRFDGRPPPNSEPWYVSVHHDGSSRVGDNRAALTALDESHEVFVTITVQLVLPFDRWVEHRDFLDAKANDIRALIHADVYNNVIINAANVLAERRRGDLAAGATQPVGFLRGLAFIGGKESIIEVGPDWFSSSMDAPRPPVGITQKLRFGGAQLVQNLANME